jgi:hypothetical protein
MAVRSFITWRARGSSAALCSLVRSEGYRGMRSRHQLRQHLHGFWLERSQLLGRELSAAVLAMPEAARTARYAELKVGWAGFVFFTGLPRGRGRTPYARLLPAPAVPAVTLAPPAAR